MNCIFGTVENDIAIVVDSFSSVIEANTGIEFVNFVSVVNIKSQAINLL